MPYIGYYIFGFFESGIELIEYGLLTLSRIGPELFVLPAPVIGDHGIGGIEYVLRGTVILLKLYDRCFRVMLFIQSPEKIIW